MKRTVSNFLRALCSLTLEHIRVIKLNHCIRVASCDTKVKTDFHLRQKLGCFTLRNNYEEILLGQ